MVRVYEPVRSRKRLLEQVNANSLATLIKDKTKTPQEKRDMIRERNPYFYVFGERLLPMSVDYHDHVNKLYLGECDVDV